jgi:2-oxoglutarate ferredoxin oxidoreductase subunit alpha
VDKLENRVDILASYKEYFLEDAKIVFVSYGSAARSTLHVVEDRRMRGERLGLLELQTLWPFPSEIVRQKCEKAQAVIVVEQNIGQVMQSVSMAVDNPSRVFLANRIDGVFIMPNDILRILRVLQGKGV